MIINIKLKNFLYSSFKPYYSYRNGNILVCLNLESKNNKPFKIKNINSLIWDEIENTLILPNTIKKLSLSDIETSESIIPIFKREVFDNISDYFNLDYINYETSFINSILYKEKMFIVICCPIDGQGNIVNGNFINSGLNISLDVDDTTSGINVNNIVYQSYPFDNQCGNVITSYPNNIDISIS